MRWFCEWRLSCCSQRQVLKKLATSGLALVLMATLLWGGCLSCEQYFMFRMSGGVSAPTDCCNPSGGCKELPANGTVRSGCRLQPMALNDAPQQIAPPLQFCIFTIEPKPTAMIAGQVTTLDARPFVPPDRNVLHSLLRL